MQGINVVGMLDVVGAQSRVGRGREQLGAGSTSSPVSPPSSPVSAWHSMAVGI
jgi:hypothetical protein